MRRGMSSHLVRSIINSMSFSFFLLLLWCPSDQKSFSFAHGRSVVVSLIEAMEFRRPSTFASQVLAYVSYSTFGSWPMGMSWNWKGNQSVLVCPELKTLGKLPSRLSSERIVNRPVLPFFGQQEYTTWNRSGDRQVRPFLPSYLLLAALSHHLLLATC